MSIPMLQMTSNLHGSIQVIMHGGEPLLADPDFVHYAVRAIRDVIAAEPSISNLQIPHFVVLFALCLNY